MGLDDLPALSKWPEGCNGILAIGGTVALGYVQLFVVFAVVVILATRFR